MRPKRGKRMSILMRLLLGLSALTLALWIYVLLANARDVSLFLQEIENRQRNQPAGGTTQYSSETQQPSTSKESTEKQEQKAKPQWYKDPQWLTLLVLAIYTAATIVYTRDCRVYSPFINNFVLCISGNEAD